MKEKDSVENNEKSPDNRKKSGEKIISDNKTISANGKAFAGASAGCPSWVHRQNSGSIFAASSTSQFWRRTCRGFWRRRITCQCCQLFQCGRAVICTQFLKARIDQQQIQSNG